MADSVSVFTTGVIAPTAEVVSSNWSACASAGPNSTSERLNPGVLTLARLLEITCCRSSVPWRATSRDFCVTSKSSITPPSGREKDARWGRPSVDFWHRSQPCEQYLYREMSICSLEQIPVRAGQEAQRDPEPVTTVANVRRMIARSSENDRLRM